MADNNINSIMEVNMEKLRSLVDSETIIGSPISVGELTIIPVSKVSFGLATGGSDFPTKTGSGKVFGGGGGAGATVTPMCFLVIKGNEVKLLSATSTATPIEKAIDAVPSIVDKISDLFNKNKSDKLNVDAE